MEMRSSVQYVHFGRANTITNKLQDIRFYPPDNPSKTPSQSYATPDKCQKVAAARAHHLLIVFLKLGSLSSTLASTLPQQSEESLSTYISMESLALKRRLYHPNPNCKITKFLPLIPLDRKSLDQGLHNRQDLLFLN